MDRSASEYAQSDQSSAATYSTQNDPRSATISSQNTPQSDYGLTPSSARSSGFPPEHLARYSHYSQPSQAVTMAQPSSPSITLPDGSSARVSQANIIPTTMHSNAEVPIDPSISQASPTYPPYSPYGPGPGQDMPQYPPHQPQHMYRPPHEPWAGYPPQHGMPGQYQHPGAPGVQGPPPTTTPTRPGQVYSFVPIPGAQQHKRPRRRYEEIERMYKCGWNGCEKAYGTLNHLNAHVTMQSHGSKRTPEEFKEIRKEWKARKKEEENARKAAEEDRQRQAQQAQQGGVEGQPAEQQHVQPQGYQQNGSRPSLPPIAYQSADGQSQGQYGQQTQGMVYSQGSGHMQYPANYPNSPYAQQGQVYPPQNQNSHY